MGIKDMAIYLGRPEGTLRQWAHLRKIPYVKMGKSLMFDLRKIEKWLEENSVEVYDK